MTIVNQSTRTTVQGNDVQTVFNYNFLIPSAASAELYLVDADTGTASLLPSSAWSLSGANNPAGGTFTYPIAVGALALSEAQKLTLVRAVPNTQITSLQNQSGFQPRALESALDRIVMQVQQLADGVFRALRLPAYSPPGVSTTLPAPASEKLIGWNANATGLQNFDASVLATLVAYGTARADIFDGDGITTQFTLTSNPGNQANLDVSVGGATKRPGIDYTWAGGTDLFFTVAPAVGVNNILVRYFQGLPGIVTDSQDVIYYPAGAGTVTRTAQEKMRETVSVKDFGAIGDGVADDTAAIQAACANSADVFFPAGVYLVNNLNIQSNTSLYGEKNNQSIIKRKNNDATATPMFNFSNKQNIKFSNLTFDGNKANQTVAQVIFNFDACETVTIDSCTIKGAFGNNGVNLTNGTGGSNEEEIRITNSTIKDCDSDAIYVSKTSFVVIDNNLLKDNGSSGFVAINYVFPPVQFVQNYMTITNNRVLSNGKSGITFIGAYVGGTALLPIPGADTPPQKGVIISNNICVSNGEYGIAYQGYGGAITHNYCEKNGAGVAFGGINAALCNATSVSNNVCFDNHSWGIDVGGSINSSCNNNIVSYTGLSSGSASVVGINFGGCQLSQCVGNTLSYNGGAGCSSLYVSGIEFGTGYFETIGSNVTIADNTITLLSSSAFGVYITNGTNGVSLQNNQVYGAAAGNAFKLQGGATSFDLLNKSNADWNNGGPLPSVASAATTVLPDVGETFIITGTTGITTLHTVSSNLFKEGVRFVQMTNQGSGYNPASPPSVTFSPPGAGTTATGVALVSNGGKLIGVNITNQGSGYSPGSPPSVTFGGAGGAVGLPIVGCNNFQARTVTLLFTGGLTVTSGSNLQLASNFTSSGGGGSTLTLMGAFGSWYEVSRKV